MNGLAGTLALRSIGSFHIGGNIAHITGHPAMELSPVPGSPSISVDPNGAFSIGQMYVQFARLEAPRSPFPLLLWHGGGLTGACWESTPDGRPGWQSRFLEAGLDVLVSDAVERGRAGWARYPELYGGEPFFMPQHAAWMLYRIGPPEGFCDDPVFRQGYPGGRFPVAAFDSFSRQVVPRWSCNDALIQSAYGALVAREGPCILLAHSQGAGFAIRAALAAPEMVRALVLIEPGGAPDLAPEDPARLARFPMLTVWGDHVGDVPFWAAAHGKSLSILKAVKGVGGDVSVLDLPAAGISGNSHLLMMDTNSDEVAAHVLVWLRTKGLLD